MASYCHHMDSARLQKGGNAMTQRRWALLTDLEHDDDAERPKPSHPGRIFHAGDWGGPAEPGWRHDIGRGTGSGKRSVTRGVRNAGRRRPPAVIAGPPAAVPEGLGGAS